MIRIELNSEKDTVTHTVTLSGKKSDMLYEILSFHKDHMDMLKEITNRLPPDLKFKVLLGLLEQHFDVSEGDDEN